MTDCAFNSFDLGLRALDWECPLFQAQDNNPNGELLNGVLNEASISSINNFKEYITWAREENNKQNHHKVLRRLAIALIERDYENCYKERYEEQLIGAYNSYKESQNSSIANTDDTFIRHPNIARKFQELLREEPQENINEQLKSWWDSEAGKGQYFRNLAGDISDEDLPSQALWGSDVELEVLARFFGIRIEITPTNNEIGAHYGSINIGEEEGGLSQGNARCLVNRGIGNIKNGVFELNLFESNDALQRRLGAIENHDEIARVINDSCGDSENLSKETEVSQEWIGNNSLCEELRERGVISGQKTFNIRNKERILQRIRAIDVNVARVVRRAQKLPMEVPKITLNHNRQSGHWTFQGVCRRVSPSVGNLLNWHINNSQKAQPHSFESLFFRANEVLDNYYQNQNANMDKGQFEGFFERLTKAVSTNNKNEVDNVEEELGMQQPETPKP